MIKKIIFFAFIFISISINASESMRKCMLLPIVTADEGKLGFQVFEELENYIKDSAWCTYRSNSELINILSQYSKNLESHLNNKDVIKVIADKTRAGSLLRVSLSTAASQTKIKLEILGDNGEDLYFKEEAEVKSTDSLLVSQTIKNWLDAFEKMIPYDGKVRGVLGDMFTIDIGRRAHLFNGSEIILERPTAKRQHPLLKEIVDFQTEKIATARVFDVNENQAQAKIVEYEGSKKIRIDDWVKINAIEKRKRAEQMTFGESDKNKDEEFGKLGTVGLFLTLGSASIEESGQTVRSKKAFIYGASVSPELWLSRNYWVGLEYGVGLGSYTQSTGSYVNTSTSTNNSTLKFKLGYKYLPLGFFYGPQIDAYAGYGQVAYGAEESVPDHLTEFSFSGILLGARASLPIYEKIRLFLTFDFLLGPTYKEKTTVFGSETSASHYRFEFGGNYRLASNLALEGSLQMASSSATFSSQSSEEKFKDFSLKLGTIFTF